LRRRHPLNIPHNRLAMKLSGIAGPS